ncbi:AfsR/SARP family transcriptional regulator [Nitriliruptor alkaliphilus]|uniref:AfsR/SARP family transcriptional regulator n=1 Tax=Nitriliruptor alkaliphilus TaxID=427918 RepID=UPI000B09B500|nr:BTAD domain-containing putative transcriptional regulator [Nitriliruptor alkaliphilus]
MTLAPHILVLGPLEVRQGEQRRAISSPLQRRLLTALTIAAGATLSSEQLIDRLWGQEPPPAARNSLQSHVARLRASLGGSAILTRPPGYALDTSAVTVDAVEFERAVTTARARIPDAPADAAAVLSEALGVWRGAAHAEFVADLARDEALRLENLRVDARGMLADAQARAGDHAAAIDTLLRLREDVALATARALGSVDRTTEALDLLRSYRARLSDELGLDPGVAITDLEQQLLRGERTEAQGAVLATTSHRSSGDGGRRSGRVTSTSTPTPPPHAGTQTLGREDDLRTIAGAFARARLVTLVGPGGVGKTRLATVAALEGITGSDGPVAWVDLATVTEPADVPPLIIDALGLAVPDRASVGSAVLALARAPGTVVLDNCEHLLDVVATIVEGALALDGPSRLVATSRERLDVAGEQVVLVDPLPVPDPATASDRDPAVQLFRVRLAATGRAPVTAAEAARVVAAVDGLPLGIELAAARAATLRVDDLLDRLRQHLDVLAGSSRRHGERHRTLSNVIGWSYDLLTDPDERVLRRASVFASTFRLADAEQICAAPDLSPADVVDAVARLVEASLITRVSSGRYRLLAPIRLFAAAQLERSADADTTLSRHRAVILGLIDRADAEMTGPDEAATIAEIEAALPDLRAVHARAVADGDLGTVARMTGGLHRFAYAQARGDILAWGDHLLDARAADVDPLQRARAIAASVPAATWNERFDEALHRAAWYADRLVDDATDPWVGVTFAEATGDLHMLLGELDRAVEVYERGVGFARRTGHDGITAYMLAGLSIVTTFSGDSRAGVKLALEAGELGVGVPTATSLAAYALGEALSEQEPDRALEAFETAVSSASAVGARFFEAIARTAGVALRGRHGDPDEALDRYRAALHIWRHSGADGMALTTLRNLVVLLARTGADADALTLHAALERLASHDSYGSEADRLRMALDAVRQRLARTDRDAAEVASSSITSVAGAIAFGLACIDRAAGR